jgi:gas vesicle protein
LEMTRNIKFFTGIIAAAVIGAVAGLLLAPKSGKETRKLLRKRTSKLGEKANSSFSNIKEQASQLGEKAQASASSIFGKGQGGAEAETSAVNRSARRSD